MSGHPETRMDDDLVTAFAYATRREARAARDRLLVHAFDARLPSWWSRAGRMNTVPVLVRRSDVEEARRVLRAEGAVPGTLRTRTCPECGAQVLYRVGWLSQLAGSLLWILGALAMGYYSLVRQDWHPPPRCRACGREHPG